MGFKSKRAEQATFIGDKLEYLFRTMRKPSGDEYSFEEVSRATGISPSYLHRLRHKKISNPGRDVIHALSTFFGIGVEYWFSPTTEVTEAQRRQGQLTLVHRTLDAGDYTPEQLRFIVQMLEHLRELTTPALPPSTSPPQPSEEDEDGPA